MFSRFARFGRLVKLFSPFRPVRPLRPRAFSALFRLLLCEVVVIVPGDTVRPFVLISELLMTVPLVMLGFEKLNEAIEAGVGEFAC